MGLEIEPRSESHEDIPQWVEEGRSWEGKEEGLCLVIDSCIPSLRSSNFSGHVPSPWTCRGLPYALLPGLCGWHTPLPGRPCPHTRPGTCPAGSRQQRAPAGCAGNLTGSRVPWTQTPGRWGLAPGTLHRAGPAWGERVSWRKMARGEMV